MLLDDDNYIEVHYSITSGLGSGEGYKYKQQIVGRVVLYDEDGKELRQIGRVLADKLLLGLALNEGHPYYEIFDTEQHIFDIAHEIFDFAINDWKKELIDYAQDVLGSDLLILNRIEIIPEYRKYGVGKLVVKNVFNNFSSGASFYVLKCYPLQCEAGILEQTDDWSKQMCYRDLEKDYEKSFYKLLAWYKEMGFIYEPDISKNVLFINPAWTNESFDKLLMD